MTEHTTDQGTGLIAGYDAGEFFDEMIDGSGRARPHYRALHDRLAALTDDGLQERIRTANAFFQTQGIGFTVYGDQAGTDRIFPFDLIPRIVPADEWAQIERGLAQRIRALNQFLGDLYGAQRILAEGLIPPDLVFASRNLRREMVGVEPPGGIFAHVAGIDLVRDEEGGYVVLEDNLRTPSGVSYMLESRQALKRISASLFDHSGVRGIDQYPRELLETLRSIAPPGAGGDPTIVLLTPGAYNSAYYEHSFLARQMGIELVESRDLVVPEPRGVTVDEYVDRFGNTVHHFDVLEQHERMAITARSEVSTTAHFTDVATPSPLDRFDYLAPSRYVALDPQLAELAASTNPAEAGEAARSLMGAVRDAMRYERGTTHVHTTAAEALAEGVGVCQDFSHVMIGACRARGIPARYVSGYLYDPEHGDRGESHSWVDVHLGDAGWLSLDPTHDTEQNEHYVRVGVGRDYGDVPPSRGVYKGTADETLEVAVTIREP